MTQNDHNQQQKNVTISAKKYEWLLCKEILLDTILAADVYGRENVVSAAKAALQSRQNPLAQRGAGGE